MIFCDTSTIAKLYVKESETPAVRRRLESEDIVYVSDLCRAELLTLLHRRMHATAPKDRITRAQFNLAVRQFHFDDGFGFFTWIPIDTGTMTAVANAFLTLPEAVNLRAADCIHLVAGRRAGMTKILTYDKDQAAAAPALGLTAIGV